MSELERPMRDMEVKINSLRAEKAELLKALQFYADPAIYRETAGCTPQVTNEDCGDVARAAIKNAIDMADLLLAELAKEAK